MSRSGNKSEAIVVGAGLAGCEAAWQLAERGHRVALYEMRPTKQTPAHQSDQFAELVCTNSFKSEDTANAHGLLKAEMRDLGSILLQVADQTKVAAGSALAVDRGEFSRRVTEVISSQANIEIVREEMVAVPQEFAVIASGPLTSGTLTESIQQLLGDTGLAFYDSIAPIISFDSIDLDIAYFASRYGKGEGDDYLNCPFSKEEYDAFITALKEADVYPGHDWENIPYFEGCLPVEVMAERGEQTLRFGPMKPVGLRDPRTGKRPWAVLQLRREDPTGQMWNMVGFQTRLRTGEQRRVFRMVPGLQNAEFLRTGSIHRNTYLNFPERLNHYGAPPARPSVVFAGQLTGVEGYMESSASGILAGINMSRLLDGKEPIVPPVTTMLGALCRYLREADPQQFQPMNSNFGLVEPLKEYVRDKGLRREKVIARARADMQSWIREHIA